MAAEQVTISMALAKEIWIALKDERDLWANLESKPKADALTGLLNKMQAAGMADWIPTLEEVRAAGPWVLARD